MKNKTKGVIIGGVSILLLAGVVGGMALLTRGFKSWDPKNWKDNASGVVNNIKDMLTNDDESKETTSNENEDKNDNNVTNDKIDEETSNDDLNIVDHAKLRLSNLNTNLEFRDTINLNKLVVYEKDFDKKENVLKDEIIDEYYVYLKDNQKEYQKIDKVLNPIFTFENSGTYKLYVENTNGRSDEYSINVNNMDENQTVYKMEIVNLPKQNYYEFDEKFDFTDLKLKVVGTNKGLNVLNDDNPQYEILDNTGEIIEENTNPLNLNSWKHLTGINYSVKVHCKNYSCEDQVINLVKNKVSNVKDLLSVSYKDDTFYYGQSVPFFNSRVTIKREWEEELGLTKSKEIVLKPKEFIISYNGSDYDYESQLIHYIDMYQLGDQDVVFKAKDYYGNDLIGKLKIHVNEKYFNKESKIEIEDINKFNYVLYESISKSTFKVKNVIVQEAYSDGHLNEVKSDIPLKDCEIKVQGKYCQNGEYKDLCDLNQNDYQITFDNLYYRIYLKYKDYIVTKNIDFITVINRENNQNMFPSKVEGGDFTPTQFLKVYEFEEGLPIVVNSYGYESVGWTISLGNRVWNKNDVVSAKEVMGDYAYSRRMTDLSMGSGPYYGNPKNFTFNVNYSNKLLCTLQIGYFVDSNGSSKLSDCKFYAGNAYCQYLNTRK